MKNYKNPEIELVKVDSEDVITTSGGGTETTRVANSDGSWFTN